MKKQKLFSIVTIIALSFMTLSCDFFTNKDAKKTDETKAETTSVVMTVDTLLAQASNLVGKKVIVEGVCSHICASGAGKIFLLGDKNSIRVEAAELGTFDQKCVNSMVTVTGILVETRVDEAYLQNKEAEMAAKEKEEHGDGGCDAEKDAQKVTGNSQAERHASFREKIAKEKVETGKEYLSFYHINAISYEIK